LRDRKTETGATAILEAYAALARDRLFVRIETWPITSIAMTIMVDLQSQETRTSVAACRVALSSRFPSSSVRSARSIATAALAGTSFSNWILSPFSVLRSVRISASTTSPSGVASNARRLANPRTRARHLSFDMTPHPLADCVERVRDVVASPAAQNAGIAAKSCKRGLQAMRKVGGAAPAPVLTCRAAH
jgi:hypothetical protein